MIAYAEARQASELCRQLREEGYSISIMQFQLRNRYPTMNGFERRRAITRGTIAYEIQESIRGGSPPFSINLPYPYPPSTGPETNPNQIKIIAVALLALSGGGTKRISLEAQFVSGTAYATYLARILEMLDFFSIAYEAEEAMIIDPCRYLY